MPTEPPAPNRDWRRRYAASWAETVLQVLSTEFPYAAGHVSSGPGDTDVDPVRLHPAFHGSFDWHSSVHMHWSAVRLLTLAPEALGDGLRGHLTALLDQRLTEDHLGREAAYLRDHPHYERPYGWAWAALLAAATADSGLPAARPWAAATAPLADAVADLLLAWLPRLAYPVRHGVHSNTAFAAALCHQAFTVLGRGEVVRALETHARRWFLADRDHPTRWEPSGTDFLSPALCEADLMRRVLAPEEFARWLPAFLPRLGAGDDPLLQVPRVLDRTDGQLVHLFGLGLSRAWQLRLLGRHLPPELRTRVAAAATEQTGVVEEEIVRGDFMSTHWLVSFALLAATAGER